MRAIQTSNDKCHVNLKCHLILYIMKYQIHAIFGKVFVLLAYIIGRLDKGVRNITGDRLNMAWRLYCVTMYTLQIIPFPDHVHPGPDPAKSLPRRRAQAQCLFFCPEVALVTAGQEMFAFFT